jgi:hypothetical protein
VIWFAELVANHADIKLIPLTLAQADRLARRGSSPISRDSGCLVDGPPPLYDFRGWPYKVRSFIAAVDVNSPKDKILTSDRGFALAVDKQHTIGQTGRFRFDKIETGSDTNISFPAGSWAIDGIWSACLDSKTGDRAVSLTFDVPATLLNAGPVKVLLTRGGSETSVLIANAGRYTLEVAPSESHSQSSNIISVRTLATWTPRDADSNSGDLRRLGVNVVSIKQIGI